MILTGALSLAVAGCMLIPQPVEMRAKVLQDFIAGCASNATRQEFGGYVTGGMVVTSDRDADGNWIALKCEFPRPKPKSRKPTDGYLSFSQEMNFCRNVGGVAQPLPRVEK